jgi:hypothetical protein
LDAQLEADDLTPEQYAREQAKLRQRDWSYLGRLVALDPRTIAITIFVLLSLLVLVSIGASVLEMLAEGQYVGEDD